MVQKSITTKDLITQNEYKEQIPEIQNQSFELRNKDQPPEHNRLK